MPLIHESGHCQERNAFGNCMKCSGDDCLYCFQCFVQVKYDHTSYDHNHVPAAFTSAARPVDNGTMNSAASGPVLAASLNVNQHVVAESANSGAGYTSATESFPPRDDLTAGTAPPPHTTPLFKSNGAHTEAAGSDEARMRGRFKENCANTWVMGESQDLRS